MKRERLIASAATIAIVGALVVGASARQDTHDTTFLTFSVPVEMPGMVLEPGTYEFRLADTASRNVVQVFTEDRSDIIGQWTFVPAERERASDETVVMFRETAEGTPPAIQYWYSPGERLGKEFIYPRDQAERIAARTGQQVRTEDGFVAAAGSPRPGDARDVDARADAAVSVRTPQADAGASVPAEQPDASVTARSQVPPAPSTERQQPGAGVTGQAQAESAEAAAARQQADADRRAQAQAQVPPAQPRDDASRPAGTTGLDQERRASELPQTASPLALTGLIGLLSLAGAIAIRRVYR